MGHVRTLRAALLSCSALALVGCASALTWEPAPRPERTRVEATESLAAPRSLQADEYLVVRGDTVYSIAFRNQVDHRELAEWNGIGKNFLIHPGQVLRLSRPEHIDPVAPENGDTAVAALPAPPRVRTPQALPSGPVGSAVALPSVTLPAPSAPAPLPPVATPAPATEVALSAPVQPASVKPPVLSPLGWTWPTEGAIERGYNPAQGSKGLFFTGTVGQPVLAAAPGRVVYSGNALRGYGELVIIKHDEIHLSAYGHNRNRLVKEGDEVKVGQPIAEMGEGPERKPLLHFEIRERGQPVNPSKFLPVTR